MNRKITSGLAGVFLLCFLVSGVAAGQPKSKKNGKRVIASVNGDPITMDEFKRTVGLLHETNAGTDNAVSFNSGEVLERMINGKLIVQEGENIGLDSLPEIRMQMEAFRKQTLIDLLFMKRIRGLKAGEKEIDELYKESIKEYKIKSIFLEKEDDARYLEDELKKNVDFDVLIERMRAEGKAKGSGEEAFLKASEMNQQIGDMLSKMKIGETSPVVAIGSGFTVIRLAEIRFIDNPESKEKAKREALRRERVRVLGPYMKNLKKYWSKPNEKLLKSLDFEADEPGFDKLLEDRRILAEIKGDKPVTVGDFSRAIKNRFFHGMEGAIAGKSVNKVKENVFDDLLMRKILIKEALRRKIDKTEEYRAKVEKHKEDLIFGMFVKKVVDPEIAVREEDSKAYYETNKSEYVSPEMIKISSITFSHREDAERAIENLRKGMDFSWAKSNLRDANERKDSNKDTDMETDKDDAQELKELNGDVIVVDELPKHIKTALTGTAAGDYRLCTSPANQYMVLHVHEVFPAKPRPFEDVRKKIAEKIAREKRDKSVREWFEKLRKASDIKIHLTKDELEKMDLAKSGK